MEQQQPGGNFDGESRGFESLPQPAIYRASGKAIPVFEFASSLRRREWLPGAFSFDFVIALVMPAAGMVACRFGALLV